MPCPCPHPLALFSLVLNPLENERVKDDVAYLDNNYLVLTLLNNTLTLDVSFYIRGKLSKTLVTLRQGIKADIYVRGSSIAKI